MKLAINDDNGRLTRASSLSSQFELLDLDRDADSAAWLASLSEMSEPYSLFLHCRATTALDRLEEIVRREEWPDHLRGVVIFNSSAYAGLSGAEHVRFEIGKRQLDRIPIHVMRSEVHDNRPQEIIDQVCRFAAALQAGRSFSGSTWLLDPPETNDATVTLWSLTKLISTDACLPSGKPVRDHVLDEVDIDALHELATRLGASFVGETERALRDLFDVLASQNAFWPSELLCANCSIRQNTQHSLQRNSVSRDQLDSLVCQALDMYLEPIEPQNLLAERIARTIPVTQSDLLVPYIANELGQLYALGCHFSAGHAQKHATDIRQLSLDVGAPIGPTQKALVKALRCEVHDMISEQPDNIPASFGIAPSSRDRSPRSAV